MSDHLKDLYKAASKGFLTSETCGPDGKYLYVCRFRNMADLHAYEDAWRAAMLAVRDGGSMRQVPEVLVKANDEIGNCPLRSPARSIAIRQFHALAGEYVRRLIDEANPAPPTSGSADLSELKRQIDQAHDNYMRGNIDATTRDWLIDKARRGGSDG